VPAFLVAAACGGGKSTGDAPPGDDAGTNPDGGGIPATCDAPATFADGITPSTILHVAAGAPPGGDGSPGDPFGTIEAAAAVATPGTAIRLGPGSHATDQYVDRLEGAAGAPIWIGGEPGVLPRPLIDGGGEALHLSRARYVVVHDLEIANQSANGVNADDGGDVADETAAHHVAFVALHVHDIGTGNNDCIKLSGVRDLFVYDSRLERCGGAGSGSGIDHVGCHRSVIARTTFVAMSGNAVQAKGGSADIDIRQNFVDQGGARAFNLGGSTGFEFFRPPLTMSGANAEARRIRAYDNVVVGGGDAPFAFVGCIDCLVAHNLVLGDPRWVIRILQETSTQMGYTFEQAARGTVANNSFVYDTGALSTHVNVGIDTAPDTFVFANNLWANTPQLPVAETGGIYGATSGYSVTGGQLDPLCAGAPEAGAAVAIPEVTGTFGGACRAMPPSIGPLDDEACISP
jgi:hypothetical protein